MKNPLIKRIPRELRSDLGKYAVIFLFMVMLISLVSGFLVADNSISSAYNEGFVKYNTEDGHIVFDKELPSDLLKKIEETGDIRLYDLRYFEEDSDSDGKTSRVYIDREVINTECLMEGSMPVSDNEIAIDRMFADNNSIRIGDSITLNHIKLTVSGLIALPDYSSLFESNTDMMFDALNFNVGVMTESGWNHVNSRHIFYCYAWKYNEAYDRDNKSAAQEKSERIIDVLKDAVTEYDEQLVEEQINDLTERLEKAGEEYADIYLNAFSEKMVSVSKQIENGSAEYAEYMAMNGKAPEKDELKTETDDFIFGVIENICISAMSGTKYEMPSEEDFKEEYLSAIAKPTREQLSVPLDDFLYKIVSNSVQAEIEGKEYEMPDDEAFENEIDKSKLLEVKDFVPQYLNNAINFAGDDMSGDKAMFILFDYIVIAVLAFIFAVTTSNTISSEAKVIGTLRASGYSRAELTGHYLILPVLVTIIAAVIGNILGYTVFKDIMAGLYYNSYSLPQYEVLWNAEAFIDTTVIPLILMIVINFAVISSKMKLSPLKFLRNELKQNPKKKAFRLNTKITFAARFRLRVLFQNIPGYIVMICGIILGAVIIIFGEIMGTIFKDYKTDILDSMICDYQYVLTEQVETENHSAEKYCMTEFDFKYKDYTKDSVSVYGIEDNSGYVSADVQSGKTAISSAMSKKYNIRIGDKIELSDAYSKNKNYEFTVDNIYDYDASLSVFISREAYNQTFGESADYFTGYFSNTELTDISDDYVLTVITEKEYTKLSDQMEHSMGGMMSLFKYFGIIMFVLIMYILSKQVIEKNFQSIAMCKILGFKNVEIGMLYVLSTSIAVIIGLILAVPLTDLILRWAFNSYLYKIVSGYFPYNVRTSTYVFMVVLGIVSYCFVAALQLLKIRKISKSEALKNVE